jgi:hypothetical protein
VPDLLQFILKSRSNKWRENYRSQNIYKYRNEKSGVSCSEDLLRMAIALQSDRIQSRNRGGRGNNKEWPDAGSHRQDQRPSLLTIIWRLLSPHNLFFGTALGIGITGLLVYLRATAKI